MVCLGIQVSCRLTTPSYTYLQLGSSCQSDLQHRLDIISHLEWCLRLAPHLIHGDSIGQLNQRQSIRKVDVEHAELSDDPADARLSGQGEFALLHDLRTALLIRVLHGHHHFGGGGVRYEVHSSTEALDLARQHP